MAFLLAGIAVIVRSLAGAEDSSGELPTTAPRALRSLYDLLVMPLPVLLAVMLSWVAFGPGTRQFAIVAGDGATAVAMSGGHEIGGRLAFGFGAVLAWFIAAYMFMVMLRRTFPRR